MDARRQAQLAADYERSLNGSLEAILRGMKTRTGAASKGLIPDEATAYAARRRMHDVPREALLGTIAGGTLVGTPAKIYGLLGEEIGEVRAVLPAEQRDEFDESVKAWLKDPPSNPFDPGIRGYEIAVPGIR